MTDGGIRIERLRKTFPDGTVGLDDVSVTLRPGELVAILGRSGAGKSTLLRCAARLIEPTSGTVTIGATDMTAARGRALYRARGRVGFVFQQFNLVRSYTAMENVLVARMTHAPWLRATLGLWRDADRAVARRCLEEVGLSGKLDAVARDLSGGQQQRVFLARALIAQPALLVLDEPTSGVDMRTAETVLHLLADLNRQGITILMTTHDLNAAAAHTPWVICLNRSVIAQGPPEIVFTEEILNRTYQGDMIVVRQDGLLLIQQRPHPHTHRDILPNPVPGHGEAQANEDIRIPIGLMPVITPGLPAKEAASELAA